MKTSMKIVILVALGALVAGAVALKQAKAPVESREVAAAGAVGAPSDAPSERVDANPPEHLTLCHRGRW